MENLLHDLRYGIRMLAKRPGLAAVAIIALALGIGANTALFSVVNAVLLRPLDYPDSERLVRVWSSSTKKAPGETPVSLPNFLDWRQQNSVFDEMAAYIALPYNLTGDAEPERINGARVTSGFFATLGVGPAIGRGFFAEEDEPGKNRVVVLSHGLWQRRFGQDPQILGKTVALDSNIYTVVGVMPPGFKYPTARTEIWVPLGLKPGMPGIGRLGLYFNSIARLKPGVPIEQAQADLSAIAAGLERQYPETNTDWGVNLVSLHEQIVGDVRPALLVLFGAVGFVLLIACVNVANLLLARATARRKEIAVRTALGASRSRIVRQLLTESVLLSLTGGAFGLLIALWGIDALVALSPEALPRLEEIGIDGRVLAFTLAVSVATGLLFGLAPALHVSGASLNDSLKEGARGLSGGIGRHRLRSLLVVSEVALALVLLIGAGLLLKSFVRLQNVSPGFNPESVLTADISLPMKKYDEVDAQAGFFRQALERIESLPGVKAAGIISELPLTGEGSKMLFSIQGRPPAAPGHRTGADFRIISERYFQTLAIPLLKGRFFTEQDRTGAPDVAVINAEMARRFWPGEEALGQQLKLSPTPDSPDPWITVVGVVTDVRHAGLDTEPRPEMYLPYLQSGAQFMTLVVRADDDPLKLADRVRGAVQEVDPDQPIANIRTLEKVVSTSIAEKRFNTLLLGTLAAVAVLLAALGIYGVMNYSVTQRTHEMGIRMALGARQVDVLKLVVGQAVSLALIGVGLGLCGALALTRLMESLLYGVSATDPLTFAGLSLLLTIVALAASFIPARRASRVDPCVALRYE